VEIKNERSLALEIIEVMVKYGNMARIRRIGYLLDTLVWNAKMMERLQDELSTSSSPIPWIPDRSAKGPIN